MADPLATYVHLFQPSPGGSRRTLLLLHGTGGDQRSFLELGRALAPEAAHLSLRGNVSERGLNRFFRRLGEGVYDMEDLAQRTAGLAAFLRAASARYSSRSTTIGSTRDARLAGTRHATHETRAIEAATETMVNGSVGLTLKSCACSTRVMASAPAMPTTSPATVSFAPCPRTIRNTVCRVAPRAMWMPISRRTKRASRETRLPSRA